MVTAAAIPPRQLHCRRRRGHNEVFVQEEMETWEGPDGEAAVAGPTGEIDR